MDLQRAQEIVQAKEKIRVMLNGVPVWIEDVHPESQTAQVHPEGDETETKTVSVAQLQEG